MLSMIALGGRAGAAERYVVEIHSRATGRLVASEPVGDSRAAARSLLAVIQNDLETLTLSQFGGRWGRRRPLVG